MPIYEYVCEACDRRCEILLKTHDAPPPDCPSCGRAALKRLLSAPGFRLSGSGWYETDFKTKNKRNLATGDAAPSGGDAGKSESGKSDTGKSDTGKGDAGKSDSGKAAASADKSAGKSSGKSTGKGGGKGGGQSGGKSGAGRAAAKGAGRPGAPAGGG